MMFCYALVMTNPDFSSSETREWQADLTVRLLDNANNINALHGKKVEEVFGNPESINEFISNLQP